MYSAVTQPLDLMIVLMVRLAVNMSVEAMLLATGMLMVQVLSELVVKLTKVNKGAAVLMVLEQGLCAVVEQGLCAVVEEEL
ncbi:hypothetical protein DVH05_001032 [Phytophthora capsici]|nr:hypothetical protein DVH05_001031 [Phytophthora capsici]KAG1713312.1 hypothetical protein DVH05_001032 [Phytophthora capsici]